MIKRVVLSLALVAAFGFETVAAQNGPTQAELRRPRAQAREVAGPKPEGAVPAAQRRKEARLGHLP